MFKKAHSVWSEPFYSYDIIKHMNYREFLGLMTVVGVFILAAYFAREYSDILEMAVLERGVWGMGIYILVTMIEVVVAPLSTLPLIPIASFAWGGFMAAILSIVGWVGGAIVAFILARKYGRPLISKLIDLEKMERLEKVMPEKHIFWSLVFLRIAIPVDILSYAVGLFTKVGLATYSFATLLGVIPFAFVFSYAAVLPVGYQIVAGVLSLVVIYLGYSGIKKKYIYHDHFKIDEKKSEDL